MTDLERLTIAQSLYKALGEMVSTKDPDSLRGRESAKLLEQYQAEGVKQKVLRVNGEEVGLLYVSQPKPTEYLRADVTDVHEFMDSMGLDDLRDWMVDEGVVESYASWAHSQGIPTPGVTFTKVAKTKPTTTVIRGCEPEEVAAALGEGLPAAVMGLIGAGDE